MYKSFHLSLIIIIGFLFVQCGKDEVVSEIPTDNPSMDKDTTREENTEKDRFYNSDLYIVDGIFVEVYTPSDYDSTRKYPIIFLNDGDLFADIYAKLLVLPADPFIMVGLSDDRKRAERFLPYFDSELRDNIGEYTPQAEAYSRSLVEEVIPFVEERYSVNSGKRAIFGISFGGLHATWIAIRYPQVFSFIGALSPSYWVRGYALWTEPLYNLNQGGLGISTTFYIDRGTQEWRNYLPFIQLLKDEGLRYGQTIFYNEVPGGDHTVNDWYFRIDIPFRLFMEGTARATDVQWDISDYCVELWDQPGVKYGRINPTLTFNNGIKYSVTSEATYTILEGTGLVLSDGNYFINRGSSLTVLVSYQDFSTTITIDKCN